jgi:hypothetical protein
MVQVQERLSAGAGEKRPVDEAKRRTPYNDAKENAPRKRRRFKTKNTQTCSRSRSQECSGIAVACQKGGKVRPEDKFEKRKTRRKGDHD